MYLAETFSKRFNLYLRFTFYYVHYLGFEPHFPALLEPYSTVYTTVVMFKSYSCCIHFYSTQPEFVKRLHNSVI